jgi:FtsP/CotA-like multicopper oxidase with cupredoxin domain
MENGSYEQCQYDPMKPELRYGTMKTLLKYGSCASLLALLALPLAPAQAAVMVQCPGDTDGNATIDNPDQNHPTAKCMHLSASDGFANMGDGYLQYIFGFGLLTEQNTKETAAAVDDGGTVTPAGDAIDVGILNAQISAPTITLEEGEEFYLSLTNTGMMMRPDLFDPHTVHFHGFPNASSIFDGVPDASVSINGGATLTYYYNIVEPGTYLYHCHVEAAEHMQMGMQGNLYVHPAQDGTLFTYNGRAYTKFAYNDGDGSTGYDVEFPLQITGFDPDFHDASMNTQPLPFAEMSDRYHMFNGRGYPTTVEDANYYATAAGSGEAQTFTETPISPAGKNTQPVSSLMTVNSGERLLIRITNLSITKFHTVTALGLPMQVIARGGRELSDKYETASVNLGGGEAYDVIIDTLGVPKGRYFVYITELDQLSNNEESLGGPMTEIVIN